MAEVSILQLTNMISYLESWKELRVNGKKFRLEYLDSRGNWSADINPERLRLNIPQRVVIESEEPPTEEKPKDTQKEREPMTDGEKLEAIDALERAMTKWRENIKNGIPCHLEGLYGSEEWTVAKTFPTACRIVRDPDEFWQPVYPNGRGLRYSSAEAAAAGARTDETIMTIRHYRQVIEKEGDEGS